ncbi:MAG: aminotransferase class III-fold pyridoxal phosphate-dependent enzyme, partial [Chloroflexota bacterium]|nr:aminotransferase class III-fold pyridoxal phosphate-dependent enzyme [Chloroflexota bacterium]
MAVAQAFNTAELAAKDRAHMVHPVSNIKQVLESGPLVLHRGEGVYLWDTDGKQYIDGFAGLWNVNVGHGRHELAVAASEQIDEVAFVPTFFGLAAPPAIELAAKLAEMFPGSLNHVQFTSGGAESNETALKIARYYWFLKGQPEKIKVISRKHAYHGIAMGALAATGIPTYHQGFGPGVPGYVHVSAPYDYRFNPDGLDEAGFVDFLVRELEETIAREGADTIAAMIAEPVQGAGGVVVPPDSYWDAITPILKKHNILLIADEVICGFGRTGRMFGMETYGFQPDKIKVISRKHAYHGIAMGALAATGIPAYHEGFGPGVPGYVHLTAPYAYRNGEGMSDEEFVASLVRELEETIEREGADTIAAMIGEPVQGAGGVVVPPDGYWDAVAPVLKKHGILLIFDEVICGFGRTGKMFGMETYAQQPDIVSFAKGITSGYVPLGGVGVSDEIAEAMIAPDRMFMHGFTYSGHPVACAVAMPNIDIIERENLPANAASAGEYLV